MSKDRGRRFLHIEKINLHGWRNHADVKDRGRSALHSEKIILHDRMNHADVKDRGRSILHTEKIILHDRGTILMSRTGVGAFYTLKRLFYTTEEPY